MWDAQLLAALIAAIAALILAILQASINRRNSQLIETLKARLDQQRESNSEYLKHYLQRVVEGKERELQAFKDLLQYVQALRDKVRDVIEHPASHDIKTLQREISTLSYDIMDCFGRNQAHFSESDMQQAHTLRTKCTTMANELLVYLEGLAGQQIISIPIEIGRRQREVASLQIDFRERAFVATKAFIDSLNPDASVRKIDRDEPRLQHSKHR